MAMFQKVSIARVPISLVAASFLLALCLLACGGPRDRERASGDVECTGSECTCPGSGDCVVDCVSDCDLSCTGSGNCDFICGPGCMVNCPGSGECLVTVGDESDVGCSGSGGCEVECEGDCSIECPGSGTCTVYCDPDAEVCEITRCEDAQSCDDGVVVCNGQCP